MSVSDLDRCRPFIQAALHHEGGGHTWEDVQNGIVDGIFQLWPGVRSAVVTQIIDLPQKRELRFFLAGGNMEEIKELYHVILAWGREHGCDFATLVGRKGWERTFLTRNEGWTPRWVVFVKELSDG